MVVLQEVEVKRPNACHLGLNVQNHTFLSIKPAMTEHHLPANHRFGLTESASTSAAGENVPIALAGDPILQRMIV